MALRESWLKAITRSLPLVAATHHSKCYWSEKKEEGEQSRVTGNPVVRLRELIDSNFFLFCLLTLLLYCDINNCVNLILSLLVGYLIKTKFYNIIITFMLLWS